MREVRRGRSWGTRARLQITVCDIRLWMCRRLVGPPTARFEGGAALSTLLIRCGRRSAAGSREQASQRFRGPRVVTPELDRRRGTCCRSPGVRSDAERCSKVALAMHTDALGDAWRERHSARQPMAASRVDRLDQVPSFCGLSPVTGGGANRES